MNFPLNFFVDDRFNEMYIWIKFENFSSIKTSYPDFVKYEGIEKMSEILKNSRKIVLVLEKISNFIYK